MLLGEEATGRRTSAPDVSTGDHWEGMPELLPPDVGPWMGGSACLTSTLTQSPRSLWLTQSQARVFL